jgi:hypothetical protein
MQEACTALDGVLGFPARHLVSATHVLTAAVVIIVELTVGVELRIAVMGLLLDSLQQQHSLY